MNQYGNQNQDRAMGQQQGMMGIGQMNMGQQMRQNPYYGQNQSGMGQGMGQMGMGQSQLGGMYAGQQMGQNPYYGQYAPKAGFNVFGETPSDKLLRGLLIGGAAAYILTNESAQKAIIKTGVKLFGALAGGVEEFKEKIMDAKAELEAQKEEEAAE